MKYKRKRKNINITDQKEKFWGKQTDRWTEGQTDGQTDRHRQRQKKTEIWVTKINYQLPKN